MTWMRIVWVSVLFIGWIIHGGCATAPQRRQVQSLEEVPYRPLHTLWPDSTPKEAKPDPKSMPMVATLPQRYWGCLLHKVQPGDTLMQLARQYYGQDRHYREILAFNQDTLPAANQLRIGQTVYLPKLANTPYHMPPDTTAHGYVVDRSDTLTSIAQQLLGDSRRRQELLDTNRATLSNPSQLQPGQVILLR